MRTLSVEGDGNGAARFGGLLALLWCDYGFQLSTGEGEDNGALRCFIVDGEADCWKGLGRCPGRNDRYHFIGFESSRNAYCDSQSSKGAG